MLNKVGKRIQLFCLSQNFVEQGGTPENKWKVAKRVKFNSVDRCWIERWTPKLTVLYFSSLLEAL